MSLLQRPAFGCGRAGNFFGTDGATGNTTTVGSTGLSPICSLGVDFGGHYFTIDSTDHLDTINPFTGAATVGNLLSVNPGTVTGISFSPAGVMYFSTAAGLIYTADHNTAADTLVGNSGTAQWNDIAFDAAGDLYGWNNTSLYLINTANASVSLVGNAGINETSMTFVGSTLRFHHQRRAHEDWQYWRYRRSGNCRRDSGAGHVGDAFVRNRRSGPVVWPEASERRR